MVWSQRLTIGSYINTGNVEVRFVGAFTDDDGQADNPNFDAQDSGRCSIYVGSSSSSCDPAANGADAKPHYDKDVARCEAEIVERGKKVRINKTNVYPGYFCTGWFEIQNSGSIPVRVGRVFVNERPIRLDAPYRLDVDNYGEEDLSFRLSGVRLCQQVDPQQKVQLQIDQEILYGAPEGTKLSYLVEIEFQQWNEPCQPSKAPQHVDNNDMCGLFEQSAALVEGTITNVAYTYDQFFGPREEITFSNITTHLGNYVGSEVVIRTLRGPIPDASDNAVLMPSELPHFVQERTYLLYLRNTFWFYSPVVGDHAYRVETIGTTEVLIDQVGLALNPNPTINAFFVSEQFNPDTFTAPQPLAFKPIFDTFADLARDNLPQPPLPGTDESTVENAHDRSSYVEFIKKEAMKCERAFEGVFYEWPDVTRQWDVIDFWMLADPNPNQRNNVYCGEAHPQTGEIRACK